MNKFPNQKLKKEQHLNRKQGNNKYIKRNQIGKIILKCIQN